MALLVSVRAAAETPVCAKAVRLMSFNIRMGAGQDGPFEVKKGTLGFLPQCAEVVKAANPDVVGVQGIDRKTNRADGLAVLIFIHLVKLLLVKRRGSTAVLRFMPFQAVCAFLFQISQARQGADVWHCFQT